MAKSNGQESDRDEWPSLNSRGVEKRFGPSPLHDRAARADLLENLGPGTAPEDGAANDEWPMVRGGVEPVQ